MPIALVPLGSGQRLIWSYVKEHTTPVVPLDAPGATLSRLLLIVYGGILLVMVFLQRWLMYPAQTTGPLAVPTAAIDGMTARDVVTTTSDGITLHGWVFEHPSEHASTATSDWRPTVILLHGNGGSRRNRLRNAALLAELGADVVLFDYRGYAENAGSPSEEGLATDAHAMWTFVREEMNTSPQRIVLLGESLGGGVAVGLAAGLCRRETPPGGLILRSTFSSMVDAAAIHYPWLPVRWVLYDRYESEAIIDEVTCPILMLHGDDDHIVPVELGRRLFAAAPARSEDGVVKRFVLLRGIGHNNALTGAADRISEAIAKFFGTIAPDWLREDQPRESAALDADSPSE